MSMIYKANRGLWNVMLRRILEYLEDRRDYRRAIAVLKRNEECTSLEDLRKELGLK